MLESDHIAFIISKYAAHHEPIDGAGKLWREMHCESVRLSLKAARMELIDMAKQQPVNAQEAVQLIRDIESALDAEMDRLCGEGS